MQDYSKTNPEFHNTIRIVDTNTPDNGDSISLADRQNYENTVYLKNKMIEQGNTITELSENVGDLKFGVSDDGCLTVTYEETEENINAENN